MRLSFFFCEKTWFAKKRIMKTRKSVRKKINNGGKDMTKKTETVIKKYKALTETSMENLISI